jgi:hypothetical protein
MNFFTIAQYFNKLNSVLFLLMMMPLLGFIAIYFFPNPSPAGPWDNTVIGIFSLVTLGWILAKIRFDKKIKSVRNAQGLGTKLDNYFEITIVRYSFLSAGSLLLALGLYLSDNDVFAVVYFAGLVLSALHWPTAGKACRDLKLKGDEREMVYFKKDRF